MKECDIASWSVQEDNLNPPLFRKAVHIIINAVSGNEYLSSVMIMKGGILLSIRYNSFRYTKDIDFSTDIKKEDFNAEFFISELNNALMLAGEELPYGLFCKIQSWKFQPPREDATFPTLKIKVGYAKKGTAPHRKLLKGDNINTVISIDYSLNEITYQVEKIKISDRGSLSAYSLTDLLSEKIRAVLQQTIRNRVRRQDIYDINLLLKNNDCTAIRKDILRALFIKSKTRGLEINKNSMADKEIIARSKKNYHLLKDEITDDLPDFD